MGGPVRVATVTDAELLQIATGYVRAANDVLDIPEMWLNALDGRIGLTVSRIGHRSMAIRDIRSGQRARTTTATCSTKQCS